MQAEAARNNQITPDWKLLKINKIKLNLDDGPNESDTPISEEEARIPPIPIHRSPIRFQEYIGSRKTEMHNYLSGKKKITTTRSSTSSSPNKYYLQGQRSYNRVAHGIKPRSRCELCAAKQL